MQQNLATEWIGDTLRSTIVCERLCELHLRPEGARRRDSRTILQRNMPIRVLACLVLSKVALLDEPVKDLSALGQLDDEADGVVLVEHLVEVDNVRVVQHGHDGDLLVDQPAYVFLLIKSR